MRPVINWCGFALAVVLLLACGNDDPAGPGAAPDIGGVWSYEPVGLAGTEAGQQVSCSGGAGELDLQQTGFTFTGTFFVGELICERNGDSFGAGPFQGQVVGGTLNGSAIEFQFLGPGWEHQGTVSAAAMDGSATVQVEFDGMVWMLTGSWSASRLPGS